MGSVVILLSTGLACRKWCFGPRVDRTEESLSGLTIAVFLCLTSLIFQLEVEPMLELFLCLSKFSLTLRRHNIDSFKNSFVGNIVRNKSPFKRTTYAEWALLS
ncbi:hypothetical protein IEQ34_007444 [Dendrobium chrysotoxum]|uniref:Uncharacterized protein n=1 Tax=Dendrobium chrysotoxum TaxID=161865 RepID=A0AAV7HB08_DENCH|nr:hypothetical protein IEQ34_007444 [Dendrobium chrysotoxum]